MRINNKSLIIKMSFVICILVFTSSCSTIKCTKANLDIPNSTTKETQHKEHTARFPVSDYK